MDKQKVFNKVKKHLLTQKKQSFDLDNNQCLYRGPNNTKCAIGCLIPNRLYREAIEGSGVYGTKVKKILRKVFGKLSDEDTFFLTSLQEIHDYSAVRSWNSRLKSFAKNSGLKP